MHHAVHITYRKLVIVGSMLGLMVLVLAWYPVWAAAKRTVTPNLFANSGFEDAFTSANKALFVTSTKPLAGTMSLYVLLGSKQKVSWNETRFEKPYNSATTFTVAALTRLDAKGGKAQLCAVVVYTDTKTASRCVRLPSTVGKTTFTKITVPLSATKQVAYVYLKFESLTKDTSHYTIDNVSGTFTLNAPEEPKRPSIATSTIITSPVTSTEPKNSIVTPKLETPPVSTMLKNGNILLVGGSESGGNLNAATLYTVENKKFESVGQSTHYGKPLLVGLSNGTVLVAGGFTSSDGQPQHAGLEVFSEDSKTFTALSVSLKHAPVSAVLLKNGTVLFLEGSSKCDVDGHITHYAAEIYNPATKTLSETKLTGGTVGAELDSGLVLVRGIKGCAANSVVGGFATAFSSDAKLFNPTSEVVSGIAAGSFSGTDSSYAYPNAGRIAPEPRQGLRLKNGNIFFADYGDSNAATIFALYNPSTHLFENDVQTLGYDAGVPVYEQADGKILLAHKTQNTFYTYDPITKTVVRVTPKTIEYEGFAVTLFVDGGVVAL